jgi:hypothetical protein
MSFTSVRATLLLLCCWACAAQAQPIRLDDSGSHTVPPNVQMQWRHVLGSSLAAPSLTSQMEAALRVAIQLDTQAYAGRNGRIYMVLPADGGPPLQLQWRAQGRLLPGRLNPGDRALVYQGVLPGPKLSDQLQLQVLADGEWASASRRMTVFFELELL